MSILSLSKVTALECPLSHLFVPVGSQSDFTSLDICSGSLAVSTRLRIGSGVMRILEHDPSILARRLSTIQELTAIGSFWGSEQVGADPKLTIRSMLDRPRLTRDSFATCAKDSPGVRMPHTLIATLRKGIARAVTRHSDGILLNFCLLSTQKT